MPILSPLENDDEQHYKAIAAAKRGRRGQRLRGLWSRVNGVKARYDHYVGLLPALEGLTASTLGPVHANDARHCYTSKCKALTKLKSDIVNALPANRDFYCQYCLISERDALDHYAPKERFPEFSVLPRNLIPCCPICNRLKGEAWLRNGIRIIINLYYDPLPNVRYLAVQINFPALGGARVDFSLQHAVGIDARTFERLTYHYEQLELFRRLNQAGADLVSSKLISAQQLQSRLLVSQLLTVEADGFEAQYGINYWKTVMLRELAGSNGFFTAIGL